jgi:hypothetical protein
MLEADWVYGWCERHLGATPIRELLSSTTMSSVVAVQLDDGRSVVLKKRPDEQGRAKHCVAVQVSLAAQGFPCSRPITGVAVVEGMATHAEEWLPGGTLMREDGAEAAQRSAALLADLMTRMEKLDARPPLPNPEWVRWDHTDPGTFPANARHDARAAVIPLPSWINETAQRVRTRMASASLPWVVGHADWEAQNLRWRGDEPHAVHDWDSLAYQPEAAIAGAAAGAFASTEIPSLAPLDSSRAFLAAYEESRRKPFTSEEANVAWAASLWPALHNARCEVLYEQALVAVTALERQVEARLALAGA